MGKNWQILTKKGSILNFRPKMGNFTFEFSGCTTSCKKPEKIYIIVLVVEPERTHGRTGVNLSVPTIEFLCDQIWRNCLKRPFWGQNNNLWTVYGPKWLNEIFQKDFFKPEIYFLWEKLSPMIFFGKNGQNECFEEKIDISGKKMAKMTENEIFQKEFFRCFF